MTGATSDSLEPALSDGAPVAAVLDLVDSAIEQAAEVGDREALHRLSLRLGAVAGERGGEWSGLAIAAARAAVLAGRAAPGLVAREVPTSPVPPTRPVAAPPPSLREPAPLPDGAVVAADAAPTYAGWWRRAVAFWIDELVLIVAWSLLTAATAGDSAGVWLGILWLPLVYYAGMHAWRGATIGKALLGVRVEAHDGTPVGLGRAVGRSLTTGGLWMTGIGGLIDLIVLAADGRKRSLHDQAGGTVVVRSRSATGGTAAVAR